MHRARLSAAVLAAALVALVATLTATAGRTAPAATTVTVGMKEFKFAFSKSSVKHGTVTFLVVNKGKLSHDLKIAGRKSALIKPGKSGKLVVTFKKAGSYPYLCTVKGHAAAGMKGVLKVT